MTLRATTEDYAWLYPIGGYYCYRVGVTETAGQVALTDADRARVQEQAERDLEQRTGGE